MTHKAVVVAIVLHVAVVHLAFQETVALCTVRLRGDVVAHEGLGGGHGTTIVMAERHVGTALQGKHRDKNDKQQYENRGEETHRPLETAPTTTGVGLKNLFVHCNITLRLNTIFYVCLYQSSPGQLRWII